MIMVEDNELPRGLRKLGSTRQWTLRQKPKPTDVPPAPAPDQLATAYAILKPLMDKEQPHFEDLQSHLAGLAMVAKYATPELDRDNVMATYQGMKRSIQALIKVATLYHIVVGQLVGGESTVPPESEEIHHEQQLE